MPDAPIRQRKFHAFLSHAHADKGVVDGLFTWLNDVSHIPVWYDARNLPTGALIATQLAEAITECRSMIIILSKASVASGWVKEEYNAGVGQRAKFPDFRILPVRIEECDVPGFLETTKWVNLEPGTRDIGVYAQFLSDLYHDDETASADMSRARDVYVSRSWRDTDEAWTADDICRRLVRAKFRLIGDAEDQQGFDEKRVAAILSSCGGLAAILPDRGQGQTSKYLLREISIARAQNLPCLLVAEPTVVLPEELAAQAVRLPRAQSVARESEGAVQNAVATLVEDWKQPDKPRHSFFGTDFDASRLERNQILRRTIEHLTAMPCVLGDEVREGQVQAQIRDRIAGAAFVVADISDENLNTCIEAGIARGAGRDLYLVARGPRHQPAFMFRDLQVWYYADDVELLGLLQHIAYPYRRRILNRELPV